MTTEGKVNTACAVFGCAAIGLALVVPKQHPPGTIAFASLPGAVYTVTLNGPRWQQCQASGYVANGTTLNVQATACVSDKVFANGFES